MYSPREFVQFFDSERRWIVICEGFYALDTTAEIADFIERIPRRHLQLYFAMYVGNIYGHAEKVMCRIGERNLVPDRG